MNTLPLLFLALSLALLLAVFAPRTGDPHDGFAGLAMRGFFRWARFWFAVAKGIEHAHRTYRAEAELCEPEAVDA